MRYRLYERSCHRV